MIDSTAAPLISTPPCSDARKATGRVVRVSDLTREQRAAMYALFAKYFTSEREPFERDLDEKESVVLLSDGDRVAGFSTLMRFESVVDGSRVTVFFSGDTIVDRAYWGTPELPRRWSQHVFRCAESLPHDAYWLLISSGFRTYRYLPLFFRRFAPSHDRSEAREARLLHSIAAARYGAQYDAATGVVRLANRTPLRVAPPEERDRASVDPHVRFFLDTNPGHADGDELACIVRISRDNLTRAGQRMLQDA